MIDRLVSVALTTVVAIGLVWFFDGKIRDYYQAPLIESYAEAQRLAKKQSETRATQNETRKLGAENAKIKQLEILAADAVRLRDADKRLQDSLRASAASETDLSACIRDARSLRDVQQAVRGFTERVVQEADKHVADKVACATAWPK